MTSEEKFKKQLINDSELYKLIKELEPLKAEHLPDTDVDKTTETSRKRTNILQRVLSRDLARGLYASDRDKAGLVRILRELAASTERLFNIPCLFNHIGRPSSEDETARTQIYRITQEAVTNAFRHANAKHIFIDLTSLDDRIVVMVKDDGSGIPEAIDKNIGMGLQIMRYRAGMIGASIDIRRGDGGGTLVICSLKNQTRGSRLKRLWR